MSYQTYVTFKTAKALRDAGFDWPVDRYYSTEDCTEGHYWIVHDNGYNAPGLTWVYAAPSLAAAAKWLREAKKIHIEIEYVAWRPSARWCFNPISLDRNPDPRHFREPRFHETYEKALDTAIREISELLKR